MISTATAARTSGPRCGDALASAANQLRAKGWVPGQSWGYEVRLPTGIPCLLEGADASPAAQAIGSKLGVSRVAGAFPADVVERRPSC